MSRKSIFVVLIILIIIVGAISTFRFIKDHEPNRTVISFSDMPFLIIEEVYIDRLDALRFEDEVIYFSLPIVEDYIDENIFYDDEEKTLIITDEEKVLRYTIDGEEASVNNKRFLIENTVKIFDGRVFIPIDILLKNYNLNIDYFENTNAIVVDFRDIHYLRGEIVAEHAVIRTDLNIKSPVIYDQLPVGSEVNVYAEYEHWFKVRTLDGVPGFIEKKFIKINYVNDIFKVKLPEIYSETNWEEKINLTWDYTYVKVRNPNNIGVLPGVNVISPTWFSVVDNQGKILDKGNWEYAQKYHEMGYEVWPLIDNDFNPDLTHDLLVKSSSREKLIEDIYNLVVAYGFHGINIDFENIHLKTTDYLTQFVRELYPVFKENGLVVSMDVTGISTSENWSMSYDRKRLSEALDYMMLMAYDQHWASSPIAGSVAEYSWVENSILNVLKYVPNHKLILAVPFYTRLWLEKEGKVTSQALSMDTAAKFIQNNNLDLVWIDGAFQYYGEMEKDNTIYKIWVEDLDSLKYKTSLIHKYDLAGIASWRRGFETGNIWSGIARVLD
ncbi:MAG: glycosyl hydrolase family 18 protein [Tissierellaceae bacterium]|nr:glycosyl hydrolase family 18 protein [Tissierellaceae bacterium]